MSQNQKRMERKKVEAYSAQTDLMHLGKSKLPKL